MSSSPIAPARSLIKSAERIQELRKEYERILKIHKTPSYMPVQNVYKKLELALKNHNDQIMNHLAKQTERNRKLEINRIEQLHTNFSKFNPYSSNNNPSPKLRKSRKTRKTRKTRK